MATIYVKNAELMRKIKEGEASNEEIADYLLRNYTTMDIALAMAEVIAVDESFKKIPITRAQFQAHFRFIGERLTPEGAIVTEARGRKAGAKVVDGKVIDG